MEADEVRPVRPGASTAVALAVMVTIAVVAAGSVVAWARLAVPNSQEPETGLVEELPESLADGRPFGEVPAAVAAAVQAPVVAAVRLDEEPAEFPDCGDMGIPLENRRLESAFVTGDALVVSVLGESAEFAARGEGSVEEPGTARVTCSASWDGGWIADSGGGLVAPADGTLQGSGGISSGCCDADGTATATASVAVPADADWLVQDRGEYRLAYPVGDLEGMALSWRYREGPFRPGPPTTTVTFLNESGEVLEERVLGF